MIGFLSTLVFLSSALAQQLPCIEGPVQAAFFNTLPKGNQFTTGPCQRDADCQSSCCGQNLRCRNPEALQNDGEFCQNGLSVDFDRRQRGGGTFFVLSAKANTCTRNGAAPAPAPPAGGNTGNTGSNQNTGNNGNNGNNGGQVTTVTVTRTVDCQATPPPASNQQQAPQQQAPQQNGDCPAGSSRAVPAQCTDAKTSTSRLGGPLFASFDNKCKGTGFTTSASTRDEQCCTGCSDGRLCRAPDALKGVQTCRDGTAPDFSSGQVRFVTKPVSDPACGGRPTDPACGVPANGTV